MRKTKEIKIGHITIGNNHPVIIQSMTNTKTKDIQSTVEQIHALDIYCDCPIGITHFLYLFTYKKVSHL